MIYNGEEVEPELSVERVICKLASEVEIERDFGTTVGNMFLFLRKYVSFSLMN